MNKPDIANYKQLNTLLHCDGLWGIDARLSFEQYIHDYCEWYFMDRLNSLLQCTDNNSSTAETKKKPWEPD